MIRIVDEWTASNVWAPEFYAMGSGPVQVSYRLVEFLEKSVVIERWVEMDMGDNRWEMIESTDHAYFILRDRLAEVAREGRKEDIK